MGDLNVIMVGGGKGGVGKSTVTAGLARALAATGAQVGVLDADLSGPSQSALFACGPMRPVDGRIVPALSADSIRVGSIGLVVGQDTALVWSDATTVGAVRVLTEPAAWEECDVLVVDLPPGQVAATAELASRFPDAECVLVTTGSALALEECRRAATFLRRMELALVGVVENMAFTACATCESAQDLFGGDGAAITAGELGVPLLARLPFGAGVETGRGLQGVVAALRERIRR